MGIYETVEKGNKVWLFAYPSNKRSRVCQHKTACDLFKTNGANVHDIVISSLGTFNIRMLLVLKYLQEFKR